MSLEQLPEAELRALPPSVQGQIRAIKGLRSASRSMGLGALDNDDDRCKELRVCDRGSESRRCVFSVRAGGAHRPRIGALGSAAAVSKSNAEEQQYNHWQSWMVYLCF